MHVVLAAVGEVKVDDAFDILDVCTTTTDTTIRIGISYERERERETLSACVMYTYQVHDLRRR